MLIDSEKGVVVPRREVLNGFIGSVIVEEQDMYGGWEEGPAYVLFEEEENLGVQLDGGDEKD